MTGNPVYLSIAAIAGFAPMIALAPLAGVLVDRLNRKNVIILADSCQAFATIGLIMLFWLGLASIYVVLGFLTVRGICQAFHSPTVSAILPSMVPKDRLSRINGLEYVLSGVVQLGGPVIAALLLAFVGIDQVLWIDPFTFVIAVTILMFVKIPSVSVSHGESSFKKDFLEGLAYVKSARGLLPLIFLATALNFLLVPFSTLLPFYVKFDHLGEVADLALIEAFLQAGVLAGGALMLLSRGFKRKIAAFICSILISLVGYALISFTPTGFFWFMAVAVLIHALPVPVANVSVRTILQTVVPLELQGRVSSVVISLASLATPLGMILSGVLASSVGTANLFLGCALIGILITAPSWFLTDIRRVENMQ